MQFYSRLIRWSKHLITFYRKLFNFQLKSNYRKVDTSLLYRTSMFGSGQLWFLFYKLKILLFQTLLSCVTNTIRCLKSWLKTLRNGFVCLHKKRLKYGWVAAVDLNSCCLLTEFILITIDLLEYFIKCVKNTIFLVCYLENNQFYSTKKTFGLVYKLYRNFKVVN